MDEKFQMFLNDIPAELQDFVLGLDEFLGKKNFERKIKSAKSGFVTSYINPNTGKTLLNYVFRKTGVKMRIYAAGVSNYDTILNEFPEKMKKEIKKASDCKKLTGGTCSPTCPAGYTFLLEGTEYKKCRNMAFFHDLNQESSEYILKLLQSELNEVMD
ncbi:MAG: hypothetical protein PHC59_15810 [Thomasclavelia ramosa]|nr:hypothetical protein [Thomasclavelia ramosa]